MDLLGVHSRGILSLKVPGGSGSSVRHLLDHHAGSPGVELVAGFIFPFPFAGVQRKPLRKQGASVLILSLQFLSARDVPGSGYHLKAFPDQAALSGTNIIFFGLAPLVMLLVAFVAVLLHLL